MKDASESDELSTFARRKSSRQRLLTTRRSLLVWPVGCGELAVLVSWPAVAWPVVGLSGSLALPFPD